jgi:hypothetical protein
VVAAADGHGPGRGGARGGSWRVAVGRNLAKLRGCKNLEWGSRSTGTPAERTRLRANDLLQFSVGSLPQRLQNCAAVQSLRIALADDAGHRAEVAPGILRPLPMVLDASRGLVYLA